jgi:hypothetical protein
MQVAEQGLFAGKIANPRMADRYRALRHLPAETLGGSLFRFYESHDFRLPGEKGGMPEQFVIHECTHILSGYGPSPHGEMLTAVFNAGAKRRNPMDWVLVALMQWHVGAPVASFSKKDAFSKLLQPDAFFNAWRRGMEMSVSLMDDKWSFWDVTEAPVDRLREEYTIPSLDPALAA